MSGIHTIKHPDGSEYVGEWNNATGEWKDDKFHGLGTRKYSNGIEYVGEWNDDKRHGGGIASGPPLEALKRLQHQTPPLVSDSSFYLQPTQENSGHEICTESQVSLELPINSGSLPSLIPIGMRCYLCQYKCSPRSKSLSLKIE
jgi:hypothetical protein